VFSERLDATFLYAGIDLLQSDLLSGHMGRQIKGRITIHEMRPTVMGRAHSEIRGKNLAERSVPWEQWLRGSALA
jgi:hypothetical protein